MRLTVNQVSSEYGGSNPSLPTQTFRVNMKFYYLITVVNSIKKYYRVSNTNAIEYIEDIQNSDTKFFEIEFYDKTSNSKSTTNLNTHLIEEVYSRWYPHVLDRDGSILIEYEDEDDDSSEEDYYGD